MKTKNLFKTMGLLCLTAGLMLPVSGKPKGLVMKPSGVLLKNTYRPGAFTQIKAGGIFKVEVYPAEADSVVIIADKTLMPYIELKKEGGMINPRMQFKGTGNVSIEVDDPVVKVYCRQLTGVEISGAAGLKTMGTCDAGGGKFQLRCSGASRATALNLQGVKDLVANVSGAAQVSVALAEGTSSVMCQASGASQLKLETGALQDFMGEISGAADVELSGSVEKVNIEASGAARLKGRYFMAQTAMVRASGGAGVEVFVEQQLQATASGAANIAFYGNPAVSGKTSGAGTFTRR